MDGSMDNHDEVEGWMDGALESRYILALFLNLFGKANTGVQSTTKQTKRFFPNLASGLHSISLTFEQKQIDGWMDASG